MTKEELAVTGVKILGLTVLALGAISAVQDAIVLLLIKVQAVSDHGISALYPSIIGTGISDCGRLAIGLYMLRSPRCGRMLVRLLQVEGAGEGARGHSE